VIMMKFPFVLLLLLCWLPAFNQAPIHSAIASFGNEQIFVQTNSTFLITGETLYFNVFCQQGKSNKPTLLSRVAYLELIDEKGAPAYQTEVSLKMGSGHGEFFIPSTFQSGNYSLIAYTQWMRNFPSDSFFVNRVTIINPFKLFDVTAPTGKKISSEDMRAHSESELIQLKLSGNKFKTREKVSMALVGADMATVSVSVRKKEIALEDSGSMLKGTRKSTGENGDADNSTSPFSQKDPQPAAPGKTYMPEARGHLIIGKLIPKSETNSKRTVLASVPGLDFVFRATTTDQQGNFVMIVDRLPESSTMLFQVVEGDINAYTVEVEDPFLGDYSKFRPEPLAIDTMLRRIIDERNVYTQIENAYYEAKKDSLPVTAAASFYVPGKRYRLDDFTRFPTMEDIFREYVPEVSTKKSKDGFALHVVSPLTGYPYLKEPLMLIDGVPILNTNTLMAYDPLKVEVIEIVGDKYFYGSLESEGIISLRTYKGAIADLPKLSTHREKLVNLQSGNVYSFPDYSADKLKMERVPDYRLQLYWNPEVKGNTSLDFYTSDLVGDFEIVVEGFTNSGELVGVRKVFSVSE
jgi:hypothetical protein